MKFKRIKDAKCPTCGEFAKGTLERLSGVALLNFFPEKGKKLEAEHAGETEIYWDEQRTEPVDEPRRVTLVCEQGHDWTVEPLSADSLRG